MNLVDTHCHLNFEAFNPDREQILEDARAAGVTKILNPGIDLETSQQITGLADQHQEVFAAVGVHPNSGSSWDDKTYQALFEFARSAKVVAIGEIGLDYYWDTTPKAVQRDIFIQQLALAESLNLPVVIHNREATQDILAILSEYHQQLRDHNSELAARPGVLHSFSAGTAAADQALQMGFFVGITGPVTFKKARQLQDVVAFVPLENLLIETDAPFLTPQPHRGKRNQPAYVGLVAQKIADIKSRSLEETAQITTENAQRLFRWSNSL